MARRVWPFVWAVFALLSLAGCGLFERAERPAWRTQAENVCFARKLVKPSAYIVPSARNQRPGHLRHDPSAQGLCARRRRDQLDKPLTIDCPMIPAIEAWLEQVVQPAAKARFGQRVAGSTYSARIVAARSTISRARNCPNMRSAMRSTSPASPSPTAGDSIRARLEEDGHAGVGFSARSARGRLRVFHDRARTRRGRLPLQSLPSRPGHHGATNTGPRRYCKPSPRRT